MQYKTNPIPKKNGLVVKVETSNGEVLLARIEIEEAATKQYNQYFGINDGGDFLKVLANLDKQSQSEKLQSQGRFNSRYFYEVHASKHYQDCADDCEDYVWEDDNEIFITHWCLTTNEVIK